MASFILFFFSDMSRRGLSDEELAAIYNDDEFWNELPDQDVADEPSNASVLTVDNREDIVGQVLDHADQSDQEEVDQEIFSDHDTASEFSEDSGDEWKPSEENRHTKLKTKQTVNSDTEEEDEEIEKGYWYGKDKTKWAKKAPVERRTPAENIISFLPGLCGPANDKQPRDPLESWSLLVSDEMLEQIVVYTNQRIAKVRTNYAAFKCRFQSRQRYRLSYINDTSLNEIKAFIGLLYLQGIFKSNHEDLRSMWSTDGTGRDIFRFTMTLARFTFLLSCLRFDNADTRKERASVNKLAPISDLFQEFVLRSQANYTPGAYLTIDEMLVPFRGRCAFRMYIPNKPAKYGIKIQILADAKTHYMCNAEVYLGARNDQGNRTSPLPNPTQVVLRLVNYLPIRSNRNITADNWYSSIETTNELLKLNFTYVGTLKKNKRLIPLEFQASRQRAVSSSLFGFQGKTTIVSHVPKKGKAVLLISTMHHSNNINDETKKPEINEFYNSTKAGVDALDEKCATYSTSRRTRRWPMTIFHCILNVAGVNSRILYQCSSNGHEISRHAFLKKLGRSLCEPYIQERISNKSIGRQFRESMAKMIGTFLPVEEVPQETVSRSKRKRCTFCPSGSDRKTSVHCVSCKQPICLQCAKKICPRCMDQ